MRKNFKKIAEKGFLLSVGLASIAKEKAEKLVKELIKRGRLNEKEGRKLVSELIKRSKIERNKIKGRFRRVKVTKKRVVRKRKKR